MLEVYPEGFPASNGLAYLVRFVKSRASLEFLIKSLLEKINKKNKQKVKMVQHFLLNLKPERWPSNDILWLF
jgi:hypothetical protein